MPNGQHLSKKKSIDLKDEIHEWQNQESEEHMDDLMEDYEAKMPAIKTVTFIGLFTNDGDHYHWAGVNETVVEDVVGIEKSTRISVHEPFVRLNTLGKICRVTISVEEIK
jgi:hypothetical protein